jgi:hypothetical protein
MIVYIYLYALREKICNNINNTFPFSHVIYHDRERGRRRRRRKTERDFIMHASRKETPDCVNFKKKKQHATIHAPETVVVKSETS